MYKVIDFCTCVWKQVIPNNVFQFTTGASLLRCIERQRTPPIRYSTHTTAISYIIEVERNADKKI